MGDVGNVGMAQAMRELPSTSSYIPNFLSDAGGGTYAATATHPTVQDFENVFGPSARNIKEDMQRFKRHNRWHLPDFLKGPNPWLTDRVDGLITDATNSPFTSVILPYRYFDNPDSKIKWNVYSFDEAMASRVPYEAAARTLTQSKKSYAGYAVRHGLALTLEHNFMMTPKGRENFNNQLKQLVGSIQYTNDFDVHVALILAPSYEKEQRQKYVSEGKSAEQICREFVDLFGFLQKNVNAMDILIEEVKYRFKSWMSPDPKFILTNCKLTFALQMTPERTSYVLHGPDGVKRLNQGPEINSYRGLNIIHTRSFRLENGQPPRDMLRRRVRVAEYYRIKKSTENIRRQFELYNEARDNWFTLNFNDLMRMSNINDIQNVGDNFADRLIQPEDFEFLIVRPNIEHNMLGIILGSGGEDLGNTLWGQTELAVYDDSMHGVWGMSYKYHSRAIVYNSKNLIRMWDIGYDGYNGGKDNTWVDWTSEADVEKFKQDTMDVTQPYRGKSMMVMRFFFNVRDDRTPSYSNWPSPMVFYDLNTDLDRVDREAAGDVAMVGSDNNETLDSSSFKVFKGAFNTNYRDLYRPMMPNFGELHHTRKDAGNSAHENETTTDILAFEGSMRIRENERIVSEIEGSGHHGKDYTGVASVRAGKGYKITGTPQAMRMA